MSRGVSLAWTAVWLGCCGVVSFAQGPERGPLDVPTRAGCCPGTLLSGCPDDYCRKPGPWIRHLAPCGLADDYCRKPCPWIWWLSGCGQLDDYCRKPCPALCRPLNPDHYSCGQNCFSHRSKVVPQGEAPVVWHTVNRPVTVPGSGTHAAPLSGAKPARPLSSYRQR